MKLTLLVNTALAVLAIALAASRSTVSSLGEWTPRTADQELGYAAGKINVLAGPRFYSP